MPKVKNKKVNFYSEDELIYNAPRKLLEIFAGDREEADKARDRGYIRDFFNDYPDGFRWNDEIFTFVEYDGNVIYQEPCELTREMEAMLTDFFTDRKYFRLIPNASWADYHALDKAIAFRGGKGAAYGIYEYTPLKDVIDLFLDKLLTNA